MTANKPKLEICLALVLLSAAGCREDDPGSITYKSPEVSESMGKQDMSEGISETEARKIAHRYFNRPDGAGVYLEDRGNHYMVAPPIKSRIDLERASVLIDKNTGEIKSNNERVPLDAPE